MVRLIFQKDPDPGAIVTYVEGDEGLSSLKVDRWYRLRTVNSETLYDNR